MRRALNFAPKAAVAVLLKQQPMTTARRFQSADAAADAPCPKSERILALEAELKAANETVEELKNQMKYATAESDNIRRIGKEDIEKARHYGITSFGKDMLEVADTLERGVEAFEKLPQAELNGNKSVASIYTGVKMSCNILQKNFSKHGIEKMKAATGQAFDPNLHEALFKTPVTDAVKADQISHVLKSGYTLKDRVLRAAQVGVAEDQ